MSIKELLVKKRISSFINLINMIACLIVTIIYSIKSKGAGEFNKTVVIYLVLAGICCGVYFFVDIKVTDIFNFLAVVFITMGTVTFAISSINTFADALNGISMFGSSGDIGYIVVLLIVLAVVVFLEIISCFMSREYKPS